MTFKDFFPKIDKGVPIERRLFEIIMTFTVALFGFWTFFGIIVGYQWPVMAIYSAGLVFYSVLFILEKRNFNFRTLVLIYYYSLAIMLTLAWVPSGGLIGAVIRFFILVFISGLLVLPIRDFLIFIILLLTVVGTYSVLEYTGKIQVAPYTDHRMLLMDLTWTNMVMLIVTGAALYYFKKEQLKDSKELEKQKIKAESADKAKTQFLATISHEMRTPLNGIVGLSNLLQESPLNLEQKDITHKLIYSSNVLNSLISDILDLSLIENGKLILREEEFDLRKELEDIMALMRSRLASRVNEVKMELKFDRNITNSLVGDINRVRQVIINLLSNSVKYTSKGSIEVIIQCIRENDLVTDVLFTVKDTGLGIPDEQKSNLFTNFYKANEAAQIEGTGLGLSISKNLVEFMGGSIGFHSTYQSGSEFFFNIPFKKALGKKSPVKEPGKLKSDFSFLKILLAEDQEINRFVARQILTGLGVEQIEVAVNGQEALDKAVDNDYDVVLMDVQMPLMDGIQATQEIIKAKENPPVIIALTANAMKGDLEACMNAGMTDFLSKPFNKEQLADIFRKHLIHSH